MKILIADDQKIYRATLHAMLQPFGECVVVEDGEQAVQAFAEALERKDPFRLVLLDIEMPFMDGQQALVQMRLMERRVYGPTLNTKDFACIIMQTSLDDPITFITAFKKGHCNGYLTKPVTRDELLEKMKNHGLI
ncbi:MAG: response regulator [Magnetococcales bacterium]|nr:response regulator [Magnetococcales bacterium]